MKSCLVKSNILYKGATYGPGETVLIADEDLEGLTGEHVELLGSDYNVLQKEIKSSDVLIKNLSDQNEKLSLKVLDLEKKIAMQDLNKNLGDKSAYTVDLMKEVDELNAFIEKLKAENITLNQGLEDFETEVQRLKSENEKLTADLKAAEGLMNAGDSDVIIPEQADKKITLDIVDSESASKEVNKTEERN